MKADTVFKTDLEAANYALLHRGGFEGPGGLIEALGTAAAYELINRWFEQALIRITYPGGALTVRTFAKYAGGRR